MKTQTIDARSSRTDAQASSARDVLRGAVPRLDNAVEPAGTGLDTTNCEGGVGPPVVTPLSLGSDAFEQPKARPATAMRPQAVLARLLAFNVARPGGASLMVPNWGCWRHPACW